MCLWRSNRNDLAPHARFGRRFDEAALPIDTSAAFVAPVAVGLADVKRYGFPAIRASQGGYHQAAADEDTAVTAGAFEAGKDIDAPVPQHFADIVRIHRAAHNREHRFEHPIYTSAPLRIN